MYNELFGVPVSHLALQALEEKSAIRRFAERALSEASLRNDMTWDEIAAWRLDNEEKRSRVYFNIECKKYLDAASEFVTEMFGRPSEVSEIKVDSGYSPHDYVNTDVTFHVRSCGWLNRLAESFRPKPKKVICNDPATIVLFDDGTKVVTKAHDGDSYDWVAGIAFCCLRKALRNRNFDRYEKQVRKLVDKVYERDPHDMSNMASELRAIAKGLSMTADALEVDDEA